LIISLIYDKISVSNETLLVSKELTVLKHKSYKQNFVRNIPSYLVYKKSTSSKR